MKHVCLLVLVDDLPQASLTLAETESLHPDPGEPAEGMLLGILGRHYCKVYRQAYSRLDKIAKLVPLDEAPEIDRPHVVNHDELATTNALLGDCWEQVADFEERFRRIDEELRFGRDQEAALANFANLRIDLGTLRSKTRFLDFYVGTVPRDNVNRLEGAVTLANHLLFNYLQSGDKAHVVIVGPRGDKVAQLESVLSSASFEALPVPRGLDDFSPWQLRDKLNRRREELRRESDALRDRLACWQGDNRDLLLDARSTLLLAKPFVTLQPSIQSAGQLAMVAGWVPAPDVDRLEQRLREALTLPFALDTRDPLPAERPVVPSVPVKSRLLQPFALLVRQYGVPRYGEVDPTPLFAATFLLMFGSMFGDVGQGGVIAGLAWCFRARLGRFYPFGVLAGLSSMLFGGLYGSIFGYEDILPALWASPIHHPILMLRVALVFGVLFLVGACLLAIYNRLAIKNLAGALFGHHGFVNLVFYVALVWGAGNLSTGRGFGVAPTALAIAALAALAGYAWRQIDAPSGEKLVVAFVEMLESVIGYISNTLSFLRVAAFSINHAALSIAVVTLAGMLGASGHFVTVIVGNLFVLVIEGGIVVIQVMRLQYYEGFSRYFSGDGREFMPLRLGHTRSSIGSTASTSTEPNADRRQATHGFDRSNHPNDRNAQIYPLNAS